MNNKGNSCYYKEIICQEGFCSECQICIDWRPNEEEYTMSSKDKLIKAVKLLKSIKCPESIALWAFSLFVDDDDIKLENWKAWTYEISGVNCQLA